ncbi:hypothetical protein BC937DRAFT_93683, partial [Endogone sp. FLAS-F59071]
MSHQPATASRRHVGWRSNFRTSHFKLLCAPPAHWRNRKTRRSPRFEIGKIDRVERSHQPPPHKLLVTGNFFCD